MKEDIALRKNTFSCYAYPFLYSIHFTLFNYEFAKWRV